MHLYETLRRPLITEKYSVLQGEGKYAFEVTGTASKPQIKQAVERAFKVKVMAVNMITVPGKRRRLGRRELIGPSWKKAVVTLKAGDKIELFESAQ
ncbi:MAG: 50S ribosomal protein L23 [Chloroflexota bacterium]